MDLYRAIYIVLSIFTAGLRESSSFNMRLTYDFNRDGLGGITQRHPDLNLKEFTRDHPQLVLTDKSGVDIALDLIRTSPPRTITYIALGPLTNLAHMIRQNGRLVRERIGRIICMGGALDVPGNISPVAECRCFLCNPSGLLSTYDISQLFCRSFCRQRAPVIR